LLEVLVCPLCKGRLVYDPKNSELICRFDKLAYPIENDVPVMKAHQARSLTDEEYKRE